LENFSQIGSFPQRKNHTENILNPSPSLRIPMPIFPELPVFFPNKRNPPFHRKRSMTPQQEWPSPFPRQSTIHRSHRHIRPTHPLRRKGSRRSPGKRPWIAKSLQIFVVGIFFSEKQKKQHFCWRLVAIFSPVFSSKSVYHPKGTTTLKMVVDFQGFSLKKFDSN